MRKFLRSFGFLIVPGLILGAVVWMLIPNGVTFRFRFNTTVDAIPGSVFQFLFGFSSGGHEIVQINPVGVFMLLLILIAFAIPLVSKTLRHPYAWQGFFAFRQFRFDDRLPVFISDQQILSAADRNGGGLRHPNHDHICLGRVFDSRSALPSGGGNHRFHP